MAVELRTYDRDEFILFGRVVAEVLHEHDPFQQSVIYLGGDEDSGKSLLALAADYELHAQTHPERYPNGITSSTSVHKMLGIDAKNRLTVFFNCGLSEFIPEKVMNAISMVSDRWNDFVRENQHIKQFYISNPVAEIFLGEHGTNHAQAKGKIAVQGKINVKCTDPFEPENFDRINTLSFLDVELEQKIKSRYEQRLRTEMPKRACGDDLEVDAGCMYTF